MDIVYILYVCIIYVRIFKSKKKFIEERGGRYEYGYGYDRYDKAHTRIQNKHTHSNTHTDPITPIHTHKCNFVVGLFARAAAI